MSDFPISPGSMINFAKEHELDIDKSSVRSAYFARLAEYRGKLAGYLGVTLEQLHDGKTPPEDQAEETGKE